MNIVLVYRPTFRLLFIFQVQPLTLSPVIYIDYRTTHSILFMPQIANKIKRKPSQSQQYIRPGQASQNTSSLLYYVIGNEVSDACNRYYDDDGVGAIMPAHK